MSTSGLDNKDSLKIGFPKIVEKQELFRQRYLAILEEMKSELEGKDLEQIPVDNLKRLVNLIIDLDHNNINMFQLTEKSLEFEDITYSHIVRTTLVSHNMGRWLGFTEEELDELSLAAFLSDLGKNRVGRDILYKETPLEFKEQLEVRKHVMYSYDMIKNHSEISDAVKEAVRKHHERMDGSGYPEGLKGDDIPMYARIIAFADAYNGMISDRPYKKHITPIRAAATLLEIYAGKLDAKVLITFLDKSIHCFLGTRVVLTGGRPAEIVFIQKDNILRPVVRLEDTEEVINLAEKKNETIEIEDIL